MFFLDCSYFYYLNGIDEYLWRSIKDGPYCIEDYLNIFRLLFLHIFDRFFLLIDLRCSFSSYIFDCFTEIIIFYIIWLINLDFVDCFKMPGKTSQSSNEISSKDPYFLHHADNPGTLLINQQLTFDNYASWSWSMTIALLVKNKFDIFTRDLLQPPAIDAIHFKAWNHNNNIVIS